MGEARSIAGQRREARSMKRGTTVLLNDSPLAPCHSPLRILTVANVPPDPNSGAAGTVYATNVALRELGHAVDEIWADRLGPRRIRHGNLHALIEQPRAYRREVLKAIARCDYDVVQISQPQGWLAAKTLKNIGFPGFVVNRSHGVELRVEEVLPLWHRQLQVPESRFPAITALLKRFLQKQWNQVAKWFDHVVVGCSQDRDCLRRRLALTEVSVIAHGVSQTFLECPLLDRKSEPLKLLHVGQYAFFKGSNILIQILNQLFQVEPDVSFTWVCSARDHSIIRSQLSDLANSKIRLLNWVEQSLLIKIYDEHQLFVFPSLFEGFGKAPFEAMARGLCVVASDEGGMHDLIEHTKTGMLCPVGDVDAFVSRMVEFIRHPGYASIIGREAALVAREFNWSRCANLYDQLYRSRAVVSV